MLQTKHDSQRYTLPKLVKTGDVSADTDISAAARAALSWSAVKAEDPTVRIRTALDLPTDRILQSFEALREPLAEKRLRGNQLTEREAAELLVLDELLGMFIERPTPLTKEAEWALREAERFLGGK